MPPTLNCPKINNTRRKLNTVDFLMTGQDIRGNPIIGTTRLNKEISREIR